MWKNGQIYTSEQRSSALHNRGVVTHHVPTHIDWFLHRKGARSKHFLKIVPFASALLIFSHNVVMPNTFRSQKFRVCGVVIVGALVSKAEALVRFPHKIGDKRSFSGLQSKR